MEFEVGLRERFFHIALYHLIVRRPNLEVLTKRCLHQQVVLVFLVPNRSWGTSRGPCVSVVTTDESSVSGTKIISRIVV